MSAKQPNDDGLPQLRNNVVSKDLSQVNKLLRENEEFLKGSLLNLSLSEKGEKGEKGKKSLEGEYLFRLDDS